jgi:L-aminopeptidase/D-esterase-like protein
MRCLAEQGQGYRTSSGYLVPIVPAAILFDLGIGTLGVYPDATMGYAACQAATGDPVLQGTIGAGTGAVCGAMLGKGFATKGGIGSASIEIRPGLIVAALVAVNAVGDITDEQGRIIAGLRTPPDGNSFVGMLNALRQPPPAPPVPSAPAPDARENTVIGVIATNAKLSKAHINKVAQMAHDGIARAVNPAHTMYDGDTLFALATGEVEADATVIGAFAAEVMAQAIRNGIRAATSLDGVRAWNE